MRWLDPIRPGGAIRLLLQLMWQAAPMATSAVVLLVVAGPLVGIASIQATAGVVGAVPGAIGGSDGGALRTAVYLTVAVYSLELVLANVLQGLGVLLRRRTDRAVQRRLLEACVAPPRIAHLEDPSLVDDVAIARGVLTGFSPGQAAQGIASVAASRALVLSPLVLLARFRWWTLPLLLITQLWFARRVRTHLMRSLDAMIGQVNELRHTGYLGDVALDPSAAKDVRVFGLGRFLVERYRQRWLPVMQRVWRERSVSRRSTFLPTLVALAARGGVLMFAADLTRRGRLDLGGLTVVLFALGQVDGILSIQQGDVDLAQGLSALPALRRLETRAQADSAASAGEIDPGGMPRREVVFDAVAFRYPGTERDVYQRLSLTLRAGESLAVVGSNGAGKTTLVKLLAGLYEPTGGRITVDGVPLHDLDPRAWAHRVAAIFQDFGRYELSAADNVGFGALALAGDRRAVAEVADEAGIRDAIERLPAGWDTPLSRRFDGGVDLSGGQWQRLALARALLAVRGGAGILVLDEPTAHLDARAEAELYDRFLELTRGVTTVVISHRFSTVRRADRIVVVQDGIVIEEGTHDELVLAGRTYARMFALQSARFEDDDAPDDADAEVPLDV